MPTQGLRAVAGAHRRSHQRSGRRQIAPRHPNLHLGVRKRSGNSARRAQPAFVVSAAVGHVLRAHLSESIVRIATASNSGNAPRWLRPGRAPRSTNCGTHAITPRARRRRGSGLDNAFVNEELKQQPQPAPIRCLPKGVRAAVARKPVTVSQSDVLNPYTSLVGDAYVDKPRKSN